MKNTLKRNTWIIITVVTVAGWINVFYQLENFWRHPESHLIIQRGQSQPPEQYHRFNYDKTYFPGMEDTLVWEHKTSISGDGITITNLTLKR